MGLLNRYIFALLVVLIKANVTSKAKISYAITVNIKKLMDNETYRGVRHKLNLPTRGQRTRSNARMQKSKREKEKKRINR